MAGQKKQLSLDANFIFDLGAEEDFAHDLLDAFQAEGVRIGPDAHGCA